ncbi:hypothetical protein GCM10023082_51970 [Streptomyces tremellae]|uniref:Uncharacterized protein n=1 Tax=Streptomyces tremellae TaxID=1124239 RepID=A0ABP7G1W6_9ACTN
MQPYQGDRLGFAEAEGEVFPSVAQAVEGDGSDGHGAVESQVERNGCNSADSNRPGHMVTSVHFLGFATHSRAFLTA